MTTETEFEQDVTAIVRKVLTQEVRNIQIGLEDQLTEKLNDILKSRDAEQDKKVAANARQPVNIAPMVAIAATVDPETVDSMAWFAALSGKWVAVVYDTMAEIPKIPDSIGKYENGDVSTVCRVHGQQSVTLKSGGRILWLAKDLKGGRGVSVNLVLRVQKRGLCIANEEALWARPTGPVYEDQVPTQSPLLWDSLAIAEDHVLSVLPRGAGTGISRAEVYKLVKSRGGLIFPDEEYGKALDHLVRMNQISTRFFEKWLYWRDA